MKDYYSVTEFAKISGVEATTLRYWDSIGIFSPALRDPENNYRFYSLAQITALNFVATMSDIGVPLKTIAELRRQRDPGSFLRLLEKKDRELDIELHNLRERSSIIHTRQEMIRHGLNIDESKVSIVSRDVEWTATLWPRNEYLEGDSFIGPLTKFVSHAERFRINLGFPVGGRYDNMESFLNAPGRPDHFFSIDPTGSNTRKKGDYVIGYARGRYGELGDLPERMTDFIKENGLKTVGHVYLIYPLDEACYQEPENYLAQVMVALSKKNARKRVEN